MTFDCRMLDDSLRDAEPETMALAWTHAESCAGCHDRLEAWDAVSASAAGLRKEWASPELWPRIHQALAAETVRREARMQLSRWLPLTAVAAALVATLATWAMLRRHQPTPTADDSDRRFLTELALHDVELAEQQYVASIERLAKSAAPLIARPETPLLASYREKLQLLDAAIAECRAQIDGNRFNADLRRELLSIYQEKQRTLEELMGERT